MVTTQLNKVNSDIDRRTGQELTSTSFDTMAPHEIYKRQVSRLFDVNNDLARVDLETLTARGRCTQLDGEIEQLKARIDSLNSLISERSQLIHF